MENEEVIHIEKGSAIELLKGWFKKYAPLEFFEIGDDLGVDVTSQKKQLNEKA